MATKKVKIKVGDYIRYKCWWMQKPVCARVIRKGCNIRGFWYNNGLVVVGNFGLDSIYPEEVIRVYKNRYRKEIAELI